MSQDARGEARTSPQDLSEALSAVAARTSGTMLSDANIGTLLRLLTSAAERIVAGASGAGITVARAGTDVATVAATDPVVQRVDALQYELGEGPCMSAWRDRTVVRVGDVASDPRWPRWAAAAALTDVASCLSAPLVLGDATLGAVKVYATSPERFTTDDEATLRLFAAQAAILLAASDAYQRAGELGDSLRELLRQRDDISRASGVVMQREQTSAGSAFTYLMSMAERDECSVHEAATRMLRRTGPGAP